MKSFTFKSRGLSLTLIFISTFISFLSGAIFLSDITERISVDSDENEADQNNFAASVSQDGRYVAFVSRAANLDPADPNHVQDIYLRDRGNGTTIVISKGLSSQPANAGSFSPHVSIDGSYVVFHSYASNLVAGDTNDKADIFFYDVSADTLEKVSVGIASAQTDKDSLNPSVSSDGNLIGFVSHATNLVSGDTNSAADFFVYNRSTATTSRVSVDSSASESNGNVFNGMISANGLYAVFASEATNLVSGDVNSATDIFYHTISSGVTELVSVDSTGQKGNAPSSDPYVTSDGNYVVFSSRANNLVIGDTNFYQDIFVRDRSTGVTERVSLDESGQQVGMPSSNPSISVDGRFVTFSSVSPNLVAGDNNGVTDVFMRDRVLGTTTLISSDSTNAFGNGKSDIAMISSYGLAIVFESLASNLVSGDTNSQKDVFVKENSVEVSIVDVSVVTQVDEEVVTDVDFVFHRVNGLDQSITADFSYRRSTATPGETNITPGADFVLPPSTQVVFPVGVDTVNVNVELINDSIVDFGEIIEFTILPGDDYSILPSGKSAATAFVDGDSYEVNIKTTQQVIREAGGLQFRQTWIEFVRKQGTAGDLTVNYTVGGTATPVDDYKALSGTVVIPAGAKSAKVLVEAEDDTLDEPYESIVIDLTSGTGYSIGNFSRVILAIKDNEVESSELQLQEILNPLK